MDIDGTYRNGVLELSRVFEEGGWVIRVSTTGVVKLYEVPRYGGKESIYGTYINIAEALKQASRLT